MFTQNLNRYFADYDRKRLTVNKTQNDHRYNSFDFCFNYFSSFDDKKQISSEQNIETSCLQLGFYLASWGMFRGSSGLLDRSLTYFIPMVRAIADLDKSVWTIDVDQYHNDITVKLLKETYKSISSHIPNKAKLTLATKIMLGVFGNVPAFDRYFKMAMTNFTKSECGFTTFNDNCISAIYEFYTSNKPTIDTLAGTTKTNAFGFGSFINGRNITKAKVIDIVGFQYGFEMQTTLAKKGGS